ncbi:MAG: hypothetical protein HN982_13785 [Candidatus Marinimicrobia bacterium]|jgi:hypothetical protein|nr:hypothetical protein [Candidatus Neomarinimicrobiota bacterium]MBT6938641.1 hypothetical protein [Candidatus Neomarinimicrobiota bacterium]
MKVIEGLNDFGQKVDKIYNEKNQLIEEQTFGKMLGLFKTKSPIDTMKYEYDYNGFCVKTIYASRKETYWTKKHFYDSNGLKIKDIQIDDGGEGYVNFEYDENGYCIAEEGVLSGGHKYRNTWKVNSNGNKIPMSDCHYDY